MRSHDKNAARQSSDRTLNRTLGHRSRVGLLCGVSALALVMTGAPVRALQLALQRGGPGSATAQVAASALASAQQSSAVAQTMSNLLRASQAIAAMQQAQAAARAAAANAASAGAGLPTVPNGLGAGGLQPALGAVAGSSLWQNASLPTESVSNGQTLVNINQQAAQAILNWQTFNVGRQTTLNFNQQGNSNWVVLNRVAPGTGPSQILGSITASGQVYVINHNGIVFGGASQVNVGALVASTADIADSQFQTNGIYSTENGGIYAPSFTNAGGTVTVEPGAMIATAAPSTVDAGGGFVMLLGTQVTNSGTILTPQGQALLAAGDNFLIRPGYSTSSNQFSTTAGNEVAIELNTLGSSVTGGSGLVTNNGAIEADTGDITLAGETVTQNGVLLSTTDVSQRGTIHLLTSASDPNASVTLTGNSLTEIAPDVASGATAVNAQRAGLIGQSGTNSLATGQFDDLSTLSDLQDESRVEIVSGGSVEFEGNSLTQAPGGQVAVSAVGRIQVDSGATIDVSGSNITLPMIDNFMQVNIQGEEESDNPQNRDTGALFNDNIWVDDRSLLYVPAGTGGYSTARYYTPGGVFNVTNEEADIGSTIGQWTASGGSITLATGSNGSVVAQTGSVFNIAGGEIVYQGGKVPQSYLIGSDGNLYNANTAPAGLTYSGVYDGFVVDHAHWGVTQFFGSSLFAPGEIYEPGYTVGRDAGSLIISAPTAILEGTIEAGVTDGQNQTGARPTSITDPFLESQTTVPLQGTLSIDNVDTAVTASQIQSGVSYTPAVTIGQDQLNADSLAVTTMIPASQLNIVSLDAAQIDSDNLGGLVINAGAPLNGTAGSITLNNALTLANGGAVSFTAPTIALNASLTAHSGTITVNANGGTGTGAGPASVVANLTVAQNVTLDTTGVWTNAELDPINRSGLAFLNGGAVSLTSTGNLILSAGGLIDASSGGAVLQNGKTDGGSGGAITLVANSRPSPINTSPFGAEGLVLDGSLRSEGTTQGGALNLSTSGLIDIGVQPLLADGVLVAGTPAPTVLTLASNIVLPAGSAMPFAYTSVGITYAAGSVLSSSLMLPSGTLIPQGAILTQSIAAQELNLTPSFFTQGFSAYNITGQNVIVAPNTTIAVTEPVLQFTAASFDAPNGSKSEAALSLWTPPLYQPNSANGTLAQRAGASLSFTAQPGQVDAVTALNAGISGTQLAPLTIGQGSVLSVDPGQSVSLSAWGELDVEGAIHAPSGTISVLNSRPFELETTPVGGPADPALSIWIGSSADLDVSAEAATFLDLNGRSYGTVPSGGAIGIGGTTSGGTGIQSSTEAFVIIRPGAVLDASGASATMDFAAGTNPSVLDRTAFDSSAFVASNGGSISLSSFDGLYIDGDLEANASGEGAAGGSLSLMLESPIYNGQNASKASFTLSNGARRLRILTVAQKAQPSGLSASLTAGQSDPVLTVGSADIGVDQIENGGFANLSLYSGDAITFNGNVNLTLAESLSLNNGAISLSPTTPNAQVTLSAPYVLINGFHGHSPDASGGDIGYITRGQSTTTGMGALSIDADQINIENAVGFGGNYSLSEASGSSPNSITENLPGFADVNLISQGDIVFLGSQGIPTSFVTTGNLDLTAARIYPATGVTAYVIAGYPTAPNKFGQELLSPTGAITIANIGETPDTITPDSVFGSLLLFATTINQGGVVDAPLGSLEIGSNDHNILNAFQVPQSTAFQNGTVAINFLSGSVTSVSANGLTMPYGGTADGLNYLYNGAAVGYVSPFAEYAPATNLLTNFQTGAVAQGLQLSGQAINVQSGAVLDLSGGGNLTGAGFIQGEGGSVDVVRTPLVSANPTNPGAASDKVYAIVPGYASGYAPVSPDAGAGNPGIGQQVTVGAGVPGLPAGTYTLLPSTYALLPGAFRVEIGGADTSLAQTGVASLPNGSYELAGNLGVANTGIRNATPDEIILTPANTVTTYSQYNQTSYSQFGEQQAALFGAAPPSLPIDAKLLVLNYGSSLGTAPALTMDGVLNQTPGQADGLTGATGVLVVPGSVDILGPGQSPVSGTLSLSASALDAFHAGTLVIGGYYTEELSPGEAIAVNNSTPTNLVLYIATGDVTVEAGATLAAPQIFLLGSTVTVATGATLSTIGQGVASWDSRTDGVVAEVQGIALSNGTMTLTPWVADQNLGIRAMSNIINVQSGATLLAGGTIGFGATNGLTIGDSVTLGAQSLVIAVPSVNIGTSDSLTAAQAAGVLPAGWSLDQTTLDNLMAGNRGAGVPGLQSLDLTVSNSINFFGSVDISTVDSATGKSDLSLVLNTPAIYGYGTSSDVATLTTGTLIWNGATIPAFDQFGNVIGVASAPPPLPTPNGPGSGNGTLDLVAQQIVFGYGPNTMSQDQVTLDRQTLGFGTVNLEASQSITANNKGALSVYQSQTSSGSGPVNSGGSLSLVTPLLTGEAGSVMGYTAGGALDITTPPGAAAVDTSTISMLGAEVDLTANMVTINSAVALPTGKLSVEATNNIQLGADANIDISGRATPMFDQTEYSWGGDAIFDSAQGNVTQAVGSIIDISAVDNSAGTITVQAVASGAGQVALNGTLLGASTLSAGAAASQFGGSITVDAQTLASGNGTNLTADFASLNTALDAGGFYGGRDFDLKQGDLTIASGQTIRAQTVNISVDNGSLAVDGTVDASAATPGNISLAAMNNLTLAGSGVLDAHGSVLQADSYGKPIDAENRATVSLTATTGTLDLASGSTIDVSSPDSNPQGDIELNAPRIGSGVASATGAGAPRNAKGNGVNLVATGAINITGAATIAVNGFATYANAATDPNDANGQIINQSYLDQINSDSQAFMLATNGNSAFQANLAGLTAYGSIFHVRPGVEIDSATANGDLTITSNLDLSGYRYSDPNGYGLQVNGSVYGSGEPGTLVVRAGGNLNIEGSISDGFAQPPTTPDTAADGVIYAVASMLPAGDLSWSVDLVSGADLKAANRLAVKPGKSGNLTLIDSIPISSHTYTEYYLKVTDVTPNNTYLYYYQGTKAYIKSVEYNWGYCRSAGETCTYHAPGTVAVFAQPALGVIRTGTGNLDLIAGGSFNEQALYGIYTAGTQSPNVTAPYEAARSTEPDGTVLGSANAGYNSAIADYQANYPTNGGNLTLEAQGDITGMVAQSSDGNIVSNAIANWLWQQGGAGIGQPAAWSINFGTYVLPRTSSGQIESTAPDLVGFSGIGTLGGGNLTVIAGGDAGVVSSSTAAFSSGEITTALNLTVASTGRVLPNGTLLETGGGTLTFDVGGALNPSNQSGQLSNQDWGVVTDLRGASLIKAGSIGQVALQYGQANADNPLPANPLAPVDAAAVGGPILAPGDSVMTIETRGDLSLGSAVDPGRQVPENATLASAGGQTGDGISWFTLWTEDSAISLYSAGGNVSPEDVANSNTQGVDAITDYSTGAGSGTPNLTYLYPPTLDVTALNGSIYGGGGNSQPLTEIELAPSPVGQIEMLAGKSIYGGSSTANGDSTNGPIVWAMSGAALSTEATPFDPGYLLLSQGSTSGNILSTNYFFPFTNGVIDRSLYAFGIDTATTDLHAGDTQPSLFYAVNGDIDGLDFGYAGEAVFQQDRRGTTFSTAVYQGAGSTNVRAGGNIINLGEPYKLPVAKDSSGSTAAFISNANPNDVSVIQAGGGIYYANVVVGGPGTLEVMAGGNIYQGDHGLIESIGPVGDINPYDHSSGANVIVIPGVGAAGPDWSAFANLYFNPANGGDPERNPGDVAMTYQDELTQWLQQTYGYTGTESDALNYFLSLPVPQQSVFDLKVYFSELNASGLEFNDASSIRDKSYIRGKEAIATLFPSTAADGRPITYSGSLAMESGQEAFFSITGCGAICGQSLYDAGIHTEFGGNIQIVDPGGAVTVGANSITPGAGTGILTEGSGDVDIYALDSVELGLSRIFTTFGGDIVVWSATGDINAGKGAKGTLVFAPARRVYDDYGNVALSPTVPTTGAGIATLSPIPGIPSGNVNLVAPEGIVDAGEAGIRVSGNINIAALQVVNAANITVQGTSTGLPTVAQPNVGALDSASSASGAATKSITSPAQGAGNAAQPSILIVEVEGYGGDDGENEPPDNQPDPNRKRYGKQSSYDPGSAFHVIGSGQLTEEQKAKLTTPENEKLDAIADQGGAL